MTKTTTPIGGYPTTIVSFPGKSSNVISLASNVLGNFIVMEGNLTDGWVAYGTFSTFEEAAEYAESLDEFTWVMELRDAKPPKKPAMA